MLLAKVVGTLVATRKDPKLDGLKFLVLRQVNPETLKEGGYVVANDAVGCGVGEYVLYASGSSARQTEVTKERPCDAVIMAIVDTWEIEGRAMSAKILPPGESASGFFYFQTIMQPGSMIYLNGLYEAASGKEIFYFELPL